MVANLTEMGANRFNNLSYDQEQRRLNFPTLKEKKKKHDNDV